MGGRRVFLQIPERVWDVMGEDGYLPDGFRRLAVPRPQGAGRTYAVYSEDPGLAKELADALDKWLDERGANYEAATRRGATTAADRTRAQARRLQDQQESD